MSHPVINADDCVGCGACAEACQMEVIEVEDVATVANPDACVGCGACQDACPAGAITEIAED